MNTWNHSKEKAGQELGISNYYQLYDSNYGQLPTLYPYPIDLDTTPLPSFQVELLLPQNINIDQSKQKVLRKRLLLLDTFLMVRE